MSELKAINAYQLTTNTEDSDVYIHNDEFGCGGDLVECYLKAEADKVIEELEESHKMEVEQLLIEVVKLKQKLDDYRYNIDVLRKEKSYNKYKRCLAMAKWCESENYTACWYHENSERCKWTEKWHERWLKIAEKFKPSKEDKGCLAQTAP